LPSASVLQFVNKSKERPKEFNFKGIGVDFKGELKAFPKECKTIAREPFWNTTESFLLSHATKENFFENNKAYNVFHCSTHGYFDKKNPLNSAIMLYIPDRLMPKTTEELDERLNNDVELQNCVVTVNDVIKHLNTSFELVFFSACVTGETKNEAGDELIGLSRGVFYSGTKAMILSLFSTLKNATVDKEVHIKNFYRYWIAEKQPKAKAFQQYIRQIKSRDRFRQPFYWFSYILIGNPY
jgi:CHAT domain-containing protein